MQRINFSIQSYWRRRIFCTLPFWTLACHCWQWYQGTKGKFFQPILNKLWEKYSPNVWLRPDFHYYNLMCSSLSSCDYYLEDSFNARCEDLSLTSDCFSLLHSSIRSIPKNLYDLELFFSGLRIRFTVMAFSKTWLNSTNHLLYNIGIMLRVHIGHVVEEVVSHYISDNILFLLLVLTLIFSMILWRVNL